MATQQELVFHDTVPLHEDRLPEARHRAESQKEAILRLFKQYPDRWMSPYEIMDMYASETGKRILITSVRRSITDLTGEFKLIKGSRDKQIEECQGSTNNRWRLAGLREKRCDCTHTQACKICAESKDVDWSIIEQGLLNEAI